jgi:NAD(P)-dependent dehydrogenase (short-subunit alcohol dehydrogenase family)
VSGFLEGKAIAVTGAGRGLGAAYALLAAREGAAVLVNDVDRSAAAEVVARISGAGGRAEADASDISQWAGAGRLVAHCLEAFGAIDGLVNNAGLFRMAGVEEQDPAGFRTVIEVNLLGSAYCGLHAIQAMLEQGSGSIVNVTSGSQAGSASMAAYGASKGGIASLTYCWAVDLAGTGVRVNAVSPNANTRMAEEFERFHGDRAPGQNTSKSPESNAPAVVFLLSDAASAINGQVVRVDGDELSLMTHPAVLGEGLRSAQWTVESVAAAFAETFAAQAQPLGLHRLETGLRRL